MDESPAFTLNGPRATCLQYRSVRARQCLGTCRNAIIDLKDDSRYTVHDDEPGDVALLVSVLHEPAAESLSEANIGAALRMSHKCAHQPAQKRCLKLRCHTLVLDQQLGPAPPCHCPMTHTSACCVDDPCVRVCSGSVVNHHMCRHMLKDAATAAGTTAWICGPRAMCSSRRST